MMFKPNGGQQVTGNLATQVHRTPARSRQDAGRMWFRVFPSTAFLSCLTTIARFTLVEEARLRWKKVAALMRFIFRVYSLRRLIS